MCPRRKAQGRGSAPPMWQNKAIKWTLAHHRKAGCGMMGVIEAGVLRGGPGRFRGLKIRRVGVRESLEGRVGS